MSLLELHSVTKRFGGLLANQAVSFTVEAGETIVSSLRAHHEINARCPKNIAFANAQAVKALSPRVRDALLNPADASERAAGLPAKRPRRPRSTNCAATASRSSACRARSASR